MKKKLKILMILTIILLMTIGTISVVIAGTKIGAYDNQDRNVIYGSRYTYSGWKPIKYTFIDGENVAEAYYGPGDSDNGKLREYILGVERRAKNEGGEYIPLLRQPNVWCVQNGTDISHAPAEYNIIGEEIEVTDPILAYILANGPEMGALESNYKHTAQQALWKYLTDTETRGTSDSNTILAGGIACIPPTTNKEVDAFYEAAKEYKNKINKENIDINNFDIYYNYEQKKLTVSPKEKWFDSFSVNISDGTRNQQTDLSTGEISINLNENLGNNLTIRITINYTKYTAKYRVLKSSNGDQRLLVSTAVSTTSSSTTATKENYPNPEPKEKSVSLEKYITKVYSGVDNTYVEYTDREWKRYNSNESAENDLDNRNEYKSKNAVNVEIGDIVEYTIKVTNTSENTINVTEITDIPDTRLKFKEIVDSNWSYNNGVITSTSQNQTNTLESTKSLKIRILFEVTGNEDDIRERLINKATVTKINGEEINNENDKDGINNNTDEDYIYIRQYKVSLQKYITKVNDNPIYDLAIYDTNNDGFVDDEDWKPIQLYIAGFIELSDLERYDIDKDGIISIKDSTEMQKIVNQYTRHSYEDKENSDNKVESFKRLNYNNWSESGFNDENDYEKHVSLYKYKNPVEVETGDTITYTIQIRNTGVDNEFSVVGIKQIYDKPEINLAKGVKLTNIQYVPRGVVSDYNLEITEDENEKGKYIIEFEEPVLISRNDQIYIDVTLTLEYDEEVYDGGSYKLRNEAGIVSIVNSDGKSVKDSDGDDNNHDCDFAEIKKYAVGLEKFVSSVNGENILSNDYDYNNDGYIDDKDVEYMENLIDEGLIYEIEIGDSTLFKKLDINGNNRIDPKDSKALQGMIRSRYIDQRVEKQSSEDQKYKDKESNKVHLEIGDEVTFTIRIKNTGNNTSYGEVRITEISDVFTNEDNVKLTYISQDKGHYDSENKKIIFNNDEAPLLEVGKTLDIKITFKVEVAQSVSNEPKPLSNNAEISVIKNRYNTSVKDSDGEYNNQDTDWVETKVYKVSLEKFVSQFNNIPVSGRNRTTDTERVSTFEDSKYKEKYNSPVELEVGDKVTYTIRLKNTGDTFVKIQKIEDTYINAEGVLLNYDRTYGIKDINNKKIGSLNNGIITFTNPISLNVGATADVKVRFEVSVIAEKTDTEQILYNTAKIGSNGLINKNEVTVLDSDGEYNNQDTDWVKTKVYKVGLEKFVSSVNDNYILNSDYDYNNDGYIDNKDVTIINEITRRGNIYENTLQSTIPFEKLDIDVNKVINVKDVTLLDQMIRDRNIEKDNRVKNKDFQDGKFNYKKENPVELEVGDKVTYTIRLKNTGNTLVKIQKIEDTYINDEGVLLNYDRTYGIKDKNGNAIGIWDNGIITFNNPISLNAGATTDVIVRFEVSVIAEKTDTEQILYNTAKIDIDGLINKNEVTVLDSDGEYNNQDTDWVKTKVYKVGLEKFVSSVNDNYILNSDYDYNNDGYIDINDVKIIHEITKGGDVYKNTLQSTIPFEKLDIEKNNIVNIRDATLLEQMVRDRYIEKDNRVEDKDYQDGRFNYKKENPVELEVGDKVTYTIRLKNTGNTLVKIQKIEDTYINDEGVLLNYDRTYGIKDKNGNAIGIWNNGIITFNNPISLNAGATTDVIVRFEVSVIAEKTNTEQILDNTAKIDIDGLINKNEKPVMDSDGEHNNQDTDWVKTKIYKVSLQKIVYSVNGSTDNISTFDRWTSWESKEKNDLRKYYDPVTLANGDIVTYAIKVSNDYETMVKNIKVRDTLPNGLNLNTLILKDSNQNNNISFVRDNNVVEFTLNNELNKDDSITVYMTAVVTESNMSVNVLKNYAEIIGMMNNRNGADVKDSTGDDNQDADYIQMKDIVISGTVWNDKAFNKEQNYYNGIFDNNSEYKEAGMPGITVKLYRDGKEIAKTTTDSNGNYTFNLNYIKGPRSANRWLGTYYIYDVKFEYDGITYTSTVYANAHSTNSLNSNAKENEDDRKLFNDKFSKIDSEGGHSSDDKKTDIKYKTENNQGYIPQSIHLYNSDMNMQSSTELIDIKTFDETQLKHINLGLRGRDIFDLELTSDVHEIKVKVNNQVGVYNYSNKVSLRKSDLKNDTFTTEDFANVEKENSNIYVDSQEQKIRNTDLLKVKNNQYDNNQGVQKIEVTYKITVHNASITKGTATKVINYFDNRYTFVEARDSNNNVLINGEDDNVINYQEGFKAVVVPTPETMLNQAEKMDIYIVYTIDNPTNTLKDLAENNPIPTYNMAEIAEYKTACAEGQTEYTRGLIDKDSAPGSVNAEQVRTTDTEGQDTATIGGNLTTVEYYFGGNDLSKLKYEDDTYATPTVYFVYDNSLRTITGTVFRDETVTDKTTKIKTGNGKIDEGEVGVFGATVELIELVKVGEETRGIPRVSTTTEKDGSFTLEGFLPGNYIIRYYYGDTRNTVLLKQSKDKKVNTYSFNGEDYQATNNKYSIEGMDTNTLNRTEKFWYVYNQNEGISTATDNVARRNEVSSNVTGESSDEIMKKLNAARAGQQEIADIDDLIQKTYMIADTNSMLFKVEPLNENLDQRNSFGEYIVSNMNFGIAEVPVTTIDLQKSIESFTITDAAGQNTIASARKDAEGKWVKEGNVIPLPEQFDVSIEDEKLQGARLQVTYGITSNTEVEKNYDKTDRISPTIAGLVDIVDNNLSYNSELGENSKYWDEEDKTVERKSSKENINSYKTIVNANTTALNKINSNNNNKIYITLEKVLSSTDSTLAQILTSSVDIYEYNNTVEITALDYDNVTSEGTGEGNKVEQRDRIRTSKDRFIILPGEQHDTAVAETITIHPPTGDTSINIVYYILAAISLTIIGVGIFGIKKFVLNKKQ